MKNQGVWEASRTLVFDQRVPRSRFHVPIWQDPAACCRGALSAPTARTVMLRSVSIPADSTKARMYVSGTPALLHYWPKGAQPCAPVLLLTVPIFPEMSQRPMTMTQGEGVANGFGDELLGLAGRILELHSPG